MSTLYLHIGTPKTGSTAIQNLMWNNTEALEKHHICYPDLGFRFQDKGRMRNGYFLITHTSVADGRTGRNSTNEYQSGLAQLEILADKYETIILSDEGIWDRSQKREHFWADLQRDLQLRGIELKIIVYLRRQDLFIQAMYAQRIKRFRVNSSFEKFIEFMTEKKIPFPYDYYAYIKNLDQILGRDALIIRIYDSDQFRGTEKTLFSDFLDIFGLSLSDGFQVKQETFNVRLDNYSLEMKRLLNELPDFAGEDHLIVRVMKQLQAQKSADITSYTYFKPGKQKEFLERYTQSNHMLAREYLGREDGFLFDETIEDLPQFKPVEIELLKQVIVTYGLAIEHLEKENREMRADMDHIFSYHLRKKALSLLGR